MLQISTSESIWEIKQLLDLAFSPSQFESRLVELVFADAENAIAWHFFDGENITAFILYTPAYRNDEVIGWHLAPVAVHPDFQNKGLGSQLIRETLALEPIIQSPVFVLGDPEFYERFGFGEINNPSCPYDPGNKHFRALRWCEPSEPFVVGYSQHFSEAEA